MNATNTTAQKLSADVVVVGSGGSGMAAAIESAHLGRSVIMLEKAPRIGGTTSWWSIGSLSANCTPHQIRAGIKDSPDEHFEDMGLMAEHRRPGSVDKDNLALRRLYVDNITETFRWLMAAGVEFFGPNEEKPHRYPRMHNVLPNSRAYVSRLSKLLRRAGVRAIVNARVTELVWTGDRVTGVIAETPSGSLRVEAAAGVIIAAGDYSANSEMKGQYIGPDLALTTPVNALSTGDGQRLGISAGGRIVHGEWYTGSGARFVAPPSKMLSERLPGWRITSKIAKFSLDFMPKSIVSAIMMKFLTTNLGVSKNLFTTGGILVNARGERFADELGKSWTAIPHQENAVAYVVFDGQAATALETWPNFVSTSPGIAYAYLRDYRRNRKDVFHQAGSWPQLASQMGLRADNTLQQTIERYNAMIDSGAADPFGRKERRKLNADSCFSIGPMKNMTTVTDGGLAINTRLQVLNDKDQPVPGLFAAGSCGQSGVLLEGHGHHIGWAFTSGRLAARSASFNRTWKD